MLTAESTFWKTLNIKKNFSQGDLFFREVYTSNSTNAISFWAIDSKDRVYFWGYDPIKQQSKGLKDVTEDIECGKYNSEFVPHNEYCLVPSIYLPNACDYDIGTRDSLPSIIRKKLGSSEKFLKKSVRMYYSEGGHIRPEDRDYVEMWACLGVNGQCRIFIRNYIEHSFFHVITTGVEFSDVVCEIVGLNDCIADCSACDRVFDENTTYFIDSSKRLWRCSPDKIPN